jgi:protein SCO1/2
MAEAKSGAPLRLMLVGMVLLLGLSAVGVGLLVERPSSPSVVIGGPFRLHAGGGRTVTEADLKGAPFLVFFGYAHCPDICPLTLAKIADVLKALGPEAKIRVVFVTVDPDRDTPELMADYASAFDPRIIGLSGDRAEVGAMLAAYRVYARKIPAANGDYTMDHSAVIYLMDRDGRFLRGVNVDRPAEQVAKDLRAAL